MTDPTTADRLRAIALLDAADWFTREGRMVQRMYGHQVAALLRAKAAEEPASAPPPADRAALRDRIADALMRWPVFGNDPKYAAMRSPEIVRQNAYSRADAVLSVLPEPADRAAVLREAGDALKAHLEDFLSEWPEERQDSPWVHGWEDAMAVLRRLAAEEQPTTEAAPAQPDISMLAAALDGLHTLIATSSRDWQTHRVDAWLWAVLCGWDCEQAEHTDTCTHGALEETAAMHGWDADTVAKARRYRAVVRALTDTATEAPRCACTHARSMHTGPHLFCAVPGCECAQYAGARQDGAPS